MKTILTLALLTALNLTAQEAPVDAPKPEGPKLESPKTEGKQTYAGTGSKEVAKISTRGAAPVVSRTSSSTVRAPLARTASLSRVNLRRPTATSAVGASQVNRAGGISGAGTL